MKKLVTFLPAPVLRQAGDTLSTLLFYFAILIFLIGFNFTDTPPPYGWYQQFMPNLNGQSIKDITFLDSLTGYAITTQHYILKTTNGGDNWIIIYNDTSSSHSFSRIEFINQNTGFVGGYIPVSSFVDYVLKTTNAGINWFYINAPSQQVADDMFVLNEDTIWIVDSEVAFGGVFRTTNGGLNWTGQAMTNGNPNKIYMYNRNIGFASSSTGGALYRTTSCGINWNVVSSADGFYDMKFVDTLTGWKANGFIKKTTDGGFNWIQQVIPSGGIITGSSIIKISLLNKDTVWGVGGSVQYPNLQSRGVLYKTTNGGQNWLFQIPDTSINLYYYSFIQFISARVGWAYRIGLGGIHTTTGGDTIFYIGIIQQSTRVPKHFELKQNYPNPFNPRTVIPYSLKSAGYVRIIAYDILGREVQRLVDQKQSAGEYEVDFMGKFTASGVYFYRMTVNPSSSYGHLFMETKKMVLVK
jgi:photosystem II stability/assembly factor-like uncharacterized protein